MRQYCNILYMSSKQGAMMKFICFATITFFLLSYSLAVAADQTITIASYSNASPGWSQYSKHNGYILHIATEAFALAGIQVEIRWYSSWKRAFEQAKNNENDSTCCWFFVHERTKDFYYSDPVLEETQVFFHLKSYKFDWNTIDDLKGIQIGGNTGFHYGDVMDNAEKSGSIVMDRARSYQQNLKKLLAGRIQIYPAAVITAHDHLNNMYSQEIVNLFTYHQKPLLTKKLHLILPKKMKEKRAKRLISLFNKGLKRLKSNGTHDRILKDAEMGVYKKMETEWKPEKSL